MKIFITGASGWIGSAVVPELIGAGHQVVGLARSDESAEKLTRAGAEVFRGSLEDADGLRPAAAASDGVIHLGFNHDFSAHLAAVESDRAVITALGETLEGSDRPLIIASGVLGRGGGQVATEDMVPDYASMASPRALNEQLAMGFADRGVRAISVCFAPTVHGEGDHGFMAAYVGMDRAAGVAGFVGDGTNAWPAVHRADAAALVRLALENAPARSVLHAVGEEGVEHRAIAEVIGRGLDLPVRAFESREVPEQFAWLARFLGVNSRASSAITQQSLGWRPTHPGLLADLEAGYYFR
jgi:nucleoside-diphosphate-sugar epimerase